MKTRLAIAVFLCVVVFAGLLWASYVGAAIVAAYASKLQMPLFSGFLTIGSFLLSLKTFILIKLKEDLYSSSGYKKRVESARQLNPEIKQYGPLKRLGEFLVYSVFAALFTAVSHITLGMIPHLIAASFCLAISAGTLCLVLFAWWEIRQSLKVWFELLEEGNR